MLKAEQVNKVHKYTINNYVFYIQNNSIPEVYAKALYPRMKTVCPAHHSYTDTTT